MTLPKSLEIISPACLRFRSLLAIVLLNSGDAGTRNSRNISAKTRKRDLGASVWTHLGSKLYGNNVQWFKKKIKTNIYFKEQQDSVRRSEMWDGLRRDTVTSNWNKKKFLVIVSAIRVPRTFNQEETLGADLKLATDISPPNTKNLIGIPYSSKCFSVDWQKIIWLLVTFIETSEINVSLGQRPL